MQESFVDTPEALNQLVAQLQGSAWIAIDTEFVREKTYTAQLGLIQLANETVIACVDPITIEDLSPLMDLLYDPNIVKIIHSGRQDLEIFHDLYQKIPPAMFDTQIAAALMGFGDQVGYGKLVEGLCGVTLEKSHARTDWIKRPLSRAQLIYAMDDVRYLGEVYRKQLASLEAEGRASWLENDFATLSDPKLYQLDWDKLWKRVKGSNSVKGKQLAILQSLAVWREKKAQSSNRPRRWIIKDEVMLDLARRAPSSSDQMSDIRGLEASTIQRHGDAIVAAIQEGLAMPKEQWPQQTKWQKLTPAQESTVDVLMAIAKNKGAEHSISTASLTSRKEIEALVAGDKELSILKGWRYSLVGCWLEKALAGKLTIKVGSDGMQLIE